MCLKSDDNGDNDHIRKLMKQIEEGLKEMSNEDIVIIDNLRDMYDEKYNDIQNN